MSIYAIWWGDKYIKGSKSGQNRRGVNWLGFRGGAGLLDAIRTLFCYGDWDGHWEWESVLNIDFMIIIIII